MKADNGNSKPKTGKKCPCKGLTNSKTSKPKHPKGWVNPVCTRVENIDRIRKAYIMWEDIPIAELYHEYASISGEFDWVIKPIWENWDKCRERGEYVDIAGIDDTLHKDEYIIQTQGSNVHLLCLLRRQVGS